ncbi:unnamed protein product [Callosobruchus maculatus]|nr:unnamed protein product [Callosobruchus maculatus]
MKGVSKAVLVPHNGPNSKGAVLFTLLEPQTDGAAFAGVRRVANFDFSGHQEIRLRLKNRGEYTGYQLVLKNSQEANTVSYANYFDAAQKDFGEINLALSGFEAQLHGKKVDDAPALDISKITSVGIYAYGGVYRNRKQNGVAALEIDYIKAV